MRPYVLRDALEVHDVQALQYTEKASLGSTLIMIAKAETVEQQTQGLSGQTSIGENQGLLFAFDFDGKKGIWMKGMLFPIDVIWLDSNLKIVHIKENFLPESYPSAESSSVPARYVLELQAGFVQKNTIKIGDTLIFLQK